MESSSRSRMNQVPLFSSGRELANLLVCSNLIDHSWAAIHQLTRDTAAMPHPVQFEVYQLPPDRTIVTFVSSTKIPLPERGDLVSFPLFQFLCTEECQSFSVNSAAKTLFDSLHNQLSELKTKLISNPGKLIITGHSLGGWVASLFTLLLLDSIDLSKTKIRLICITFGSPLIGDDGIQKAISQHLMWNSQFLHIVSNQDPVSGLFLSSQEFAAISSSSQSYSPVGTYLLCSEQGCACSENPDLISTWLQAMSSEGVRGFHPVDYGRIFKDLKDRAIFKGLEQPGRRSADPFEVGIIMELETIGLHPTQIFHNSSHSYNPWQQQRNIGIDHLRQQAKLLAQKRKASDSGKLNDAKIDMAQLEWYKKKSKDEGKGYYDCFKNQQLKRDIKVEGFRANLTTYWKDMVEQAKRKPQTVGAAFRKRWLLGGTVYRRMVEPLEIAAYYRDGGRDYMKKGRPPHYKLLQQWFENQVNPQPRVELDDKRQKVSAILTEDSCFWAHVEEAILSCKLLKSSESSLEQKKSSRDDLVKFGVYVMKLIKSYAVSPEIFLPGSSFMNWWKDYEKLVDNNSCTCPLFTFMKRREYRQYG